MRRIKLDFDIFNKSTSLNTQMLRIRSKVTVATTRKFILFLIIYFESFFILKSIAFLTSSGNGGASFLLKSEKCKMKM